MNPEVRRLPKKTIITICLIIAVGIMGFLELKSLKEQKLGEVLASIGYKNVKDLKVINKLSVEDKETRYKSDVYKVMFFDNESKKTCIGFVHKERDGRYTKDLDCK